MKKGELTSNQIIALVLVIGGFLILLFILFGLELGKYSEDEICKLSVLARSQVGGASGAQSFVPLRCSTGKICINDGRGGCDEVFAGEGIEQVKIPRVESQKDADKIGRAARIIEEVSAEGMYNCWNTMGQGKLDLYGGAKDEILEEFGIVPEKTTCVICSRVAVDKNVPDYVLNEVNINEYLRTHQIPGGGLTYLQAFTDKGIGSYASVNANPFTSDYNNKLNEGIALEDEEEKKRYSQLQLQGGEQTNREMAFLFMQIKAKSIGDVLKNMAGAGATVAGATFMTPVAGKIAGRVLFTPWGAAIAAFGAGAAGGYGAYNAKQGQLTASGYCGEFASGDAEAQKGCSIVQGVNYNFRDINQICASIQGNL